MKEDREKHRTVCLEMRHVFDNHLGIVFSICLIVCTNTTPVPNLLEHSVAQWVWRVWEWQVATTCCFWLFIDLLDHFRCYKSCKCKWMSGNCCEFHCRFESKTFVKIIHAKYHQQREIYCSLHMQAKRIHMLSYSQAANQFSYSCQCLYVWFIGNNYNFRVIIYNHQNMTQMSCVKQKQKNTFSSWTSDVRCLRGITMNNTWDGFSPVGWISVFRRLRGHLGIEFMSSYSSLYSISLIFHVGHVASKSKKRKEGNTFLLTMGQAGHLVSSFKFYCHVHEYSEMPFLQAHFPTMQWIWISICVTLNFKRSLSQCNYQGVKMKACYYAWDKWAGFY